MLEKHVFLEALNQLKNTNDCIKIDPPGLGQKLKNERRSENLNKMRIG